MRKKDLVALMKNLPRTRLQQFSVYEVVSLSINKVAIYSGILKEFWIVERTDVMLLKEYQHNQRIKKLKRVLYESL